MGSLMLPWGKNLEACLWDLDGTLIDSYPAIAASVNHVRDHFGLAPLTVGEVRVCVGHGVDRLMQQTVPGVDPVQAREMYGKHHAATLQGGTVLLPGAGELLAVMKNFGVKHAVCSNKPRHFSEQVLSFLGIEPFVDMLLGPEDVRAKKPAPDMLLLALEKLAVFPENSLFVGDMTVDIQAARSASLSVAVVATGSDSLEKLRQANPDLLAPNLLELSAILGVQAAKAQA